MDNKEIFEKAFDMLIDEAAAKVSEEDLFTDAASEVEFSKEHEAKMQKLFKSIEKEDRKSKILFFSKRVACILAVILAVSSVSIISVDAWRERFLNILFDKNAPNSYITFNNETNRYSDEHITLDYLPPGFKVKKQQATTKGIYVYFSNDNLFIYIRINDLTGQFNVDTENASIEYTTINNCDAISVLKDDLNQIVWADNDTSYYVCGNIPNEEIIKIAENLKKL